MAGRGQDEQAAGRHAAEIESPAGTERDAGTETDCECRDGHQGGGTAASSGLEGCADESGRRENKPEG